MKHRILFKVCTVTEIIVGSLLLSVVLIALAPFIYFGMLVALYGNPIILIIAVLAALGCITVYLMALISTIANAANNRHKKKTQTVEA